MIVLWKLSLLMCLCSLGFAEEDVVVSHLMLWISVGVFSILSKHIFILSAET